MDQKRRYTAEEIEQMRILFAKKKTDEQIAKKLGRTIISVQYKRRQLGLTRPDAVQISMKHRHKFSMDDEEFIRNYWKVKSDRWMARKLGCTIAVYKKKRRRMGLIKTWTHTKGKRITWRANEEFFLIDNYGSHSARWIAKQLGRCECAIWAKANRMGLKKDFIPGRRGYDDEKNNYYSK